MTAFDGLSALDSDREQKLAGRRGPRPVPAPKKYAPAGESTPVPTESPEDSAEAPVVVDLRENPPEETSEPERRVQDPQRRTTAKTASKDAAGEKQALRAAQIYMDPTTDDHLRRIKAAALVEGTDVTGSAVVRRAVAELVERHGYDGVVRLIASDPIAQRGKGRPRR